MQRTQAQSLVCRIPHAAEQLSCSRATTPDARAPRACAQEREKPPQREAWAPQLDEALLSAARESPQAAMKTQLSQTYTNK